MIRHPPHEALIGIRIAHQADRELLAGFLRQTGYAVQILAPADMAQKSPAISLIVIERRAPDDCS